MENITKENEQKIIDKVFKKLLVIKILNNDEKYLVKNVFDVLVHYIKIGNHSFDSSKEAAIDIEIKNSGRFVESNRKGIYEIVYNSLLEALKYEDLKIGIDTNYIKNNATKYKDSEAKAHGKEI